MKEIFSFRVVWTAELRICDSGPKFGYFRIFLLHIAGAANCWPKVGPLCADMTFFPFTK
jgi:hypothetical protein